MGIVNRKGRWGLAGAGLLAACIAGVIFLPNRHPRIKECPRFDPAYWDGLDGYLAVRTNDTGELLLALFGKEQNVNLTKGKEISILPTRTIYRWLPGQKELSVASKEDWAKASGKPVLSDHLGAGPSQSFKYDVRRYALMRAGTDVHTEGRTVAALNGSPDGRYIAVASTDTRPSKWETWPMAGRGLESNLWFHQVLDCATGEQVGETLALRHDTRMWAPEICWSSDSNYVVYMDFGCRWIWIAPVHPNERGGRS